MKIDVCSTPIQVRLNDHGREILANQHSDLLSHYRMTSDELPFRLPKKTFGAHMSNGKPIPFDAEICISDEN